MGNTHPSPLPLTLFQRPVHIKPVSALQTLISAPSSRHLAPVSSPFNDILCQLPKAQPEPLSCTRQFPALENHTQQHTSPDASDPQWAMRQTEG